MSDDNHDTDFRDHERLLRSHVRRNEIDAALALISEHLTIKCKSCRKKPVSEETWPYILYCWKCRSIGITLAPSEFVTNTIFQLARVIEQQIAALPPAESGEILDLDDVEPVYRSAKAFWNVVRYLPNPVCTDARHPLRLQYRTYAPLCDAFYYRPGEGMRRYGTILHKNTAWQLEMPGRSYLIAAGPGIYLGEQGQWVTESDMCPALPPANALAIKKLETLLGIGSTADPDHTAPDKE